MPKRMFAILLFALAAWSAPAQAVVHAGDVAPNFTKNRLAAGPAVGAPLSLSDYAGKVVVLALAGHNCTFCLANGPSVEADVWQHYQTTRPGQVQVLSADVYNGTPSQLESFRTQTGVTYPLLLNATLAAGGNLYQLYYPDTDDYVVINKAGIVRYHAADLHAHGQRYVLGELRNCIDSLVTATVDVGDEPLSLAPRLEVTPNPFVSHVGVQLANPAAHPTHARVTVHDLAGRRVATLHDGPVAQGPTRLTWDGRIANAPAAAGVYLVRAELAGRVLVRRAVRVR